MRGRVDERLRQKIHDASKKLSYMFWRAGVITNHFFVWCYNRNEWPQLDAPPGSKKSQKNHNQTMFRNVIKLGTYTNKPPENQANWEQLNRFWKEEGQFHAPEPVFGVGSNQAIEMAADKLRDNTITELTRSFFEPKQKKVFEAEYGQEAEIMRERANGVRTGMLHQDKPTHLGGAPLPETRATSETFLKKNLGATVFATADLTRRYEAIHGCGSGWSLAPIPKLNRKRMQFVRRALLDLAHPNQANVISKEQFKRSDEKAIERLLLRRKKDASGRFRGPGNHKVFDNFIDADGVTMCVHFCHSTEPSSGNDNCSEELLPASVSEDEVDIAEVGAIDPGRKKPVTYWSPTVGARSIGREEYNRRSGADLQKKVSDNRIKELRVSEHERLRANPGKTVSLTGIRRFALAQAETAAARWAVACQGDRELHLKFRTERGKTQVVDRFFQEIRKKCNNNIVIMYGDGQFNASGPGEPGGVPTKSMKRACKRHFLTRSANEFRTSRSCPFCKQADVADAGSDRVLCQHCLASANKDVIGAINIRRGGIAEAKKRERPEDLRARPDQRGAADCPTQAFQNATATAVV
jgi:hypothetical protein